MTATPPPRPGPAGVGGGGLLRIALPFYGVVALFAFGYALFSRTLSRLLGERPPTLAAVLGALGIGLALVVLTRVASAGWKPFTRMRDTLTELVGPVDVRTALALALVSGVGEELLFRGALWPHLGLVGTTLLFGLVHVLPRASLWVYPVFAVLAGLLFGLLREGSQSVLPPMLAHVTVNALNLVWLGRRARALAADDGPADAEAATEGHAEAGAVRRTDERAAPAESTATEEGGGA